MKIPPEVLERIQNTASGLQHGNVTLTIYIRDGQPRYKWGYEEWLNEFEGLGTQYDFYTGEKTGQNKKSDSSGSVKSIIRVSRGNQNTTT
jgi:hypothetical protein